MKDTTNLLDYNPYSAGEYSNDLSGIYRTNANHEIIIRGSLKKMKTN